MATITKGSSAFQNAILSPDERVQVSRARLKSKPKPKVRSGAPTKAYTEALLSPDLRSGAVLPRATSSPVIDLSLLAGHQIAPLITLPTLNADPSPAFLNGRPIMPIASSDIAKNQIAVSPAGTEQMVWADEDDYLGGGGGATSYVDTSGTVPTGYGALTGAVDGVNATFVVSQSSYNAGTLKVFRNGMMVDPDALTYTPATGTFVFDTPPLSGNLITAIYDD